MERKYVLVINPGSTSTKVAVYEGYERKAQENITHETSDLEKYEKVTDQYEYRKEMIVKWLIDKNFNPSKLVAVVGRGGLLRPMPSGTYKVSKQMIDDLVVGIQGEHASNLGGMIAGAIAESENIEAYIVDPVAVDEFEDVARVSGTPQIIRKSLVHALNIKAIAHRVANDKNVKVEDLNLVIAHLGGGISVVPLLKGRMIDANNANEMGPFSPERTGSLPVGDVAKICFSGDYTFAEIKKKLRGKGGMTAYLGTNDAREVLKRIEDGDENAKLIFEAMGYQISKEIGAMATVLQGQIDAIVLTGGVAYSKYLTDYIKERVAFIAPVILKPGEDEMEALNEGVQRVLSGEETAKIYEEEVVFND
ncbi:butyrate kinase [Fusibacter sp. Q10-2]|uniref:Probable butyrate kinase n=1 Tax=Fusibacter ferrireducens TaxID=2785058 RepID=A0ABR9ZVJ3_9FIRM|nr:butyrate kinase [Fusibacter ferrireducens]MBF4694356.1 butyrate kinase [Fusibacter ferrireducens]